MRELLYLIGPPGVGKTTALAQALAGVATVPCTHPFLMRLYEGPRPALDWTGVQIGGPRQGFAGTDTLPMNVQPTVEEWLEHTSAQRIVAEGDRLANPKFFHAAERNGWHLTVLYFAAPWEVCDARRLERACALGTKMQDEAWLRGRHTKCENLALSWCRREHWLDGCASREWMVQALQAHPVIRGLRGEG